MEFNNEYTGIIVRRLFENGVQDSERITLVSGEDDRKISIHRSILTAASKYFAAALGPNFHESSQTEFVLDDIDGSMLRAIVDFCYTGRIELTEENVSKYLAIASSRELDLLEKECWTLLAKQVSVNNAVQFWRIADKYSNLDVSQRALHMICESFEKFSIENIRTFDYRLMEGVLKSTSLYAPEELVFKRLMEWYRFNEDKRKQQITTLLKLIRLEFISPQVLNDNQFEEIFKLFECFELIHAEYKKRSLCRGLSAGIRRRRSIFCLFRQEKGAQQSAVKIERYNSASNEFDEASEIALGDRKLFGVTLHENKVYILGGGINGVYQKSFKMFDLATGEETVLPEMNFARGNSDPIVFGKHIYMFGGYGDTGPLNSCERFDLLSKTWTTLKPMNVARYSASAAIFQGYIYVAGGRDSGSKILDIVELYDPTNNDWLQVASMNQARAASAFFASNRFLYAIGNQSIIERCDCAAVRPRWTKVGWFAGSENVSNAVETSDGVFVVMRDGKFARFDVNANGVHSFQLMGKSKNESKFVGKHFLSQN